MEIEIENIEYLTDFPVNFIDVPRISFDNLTYNQFYHQYMSRNLPIIITGLKIKTPNVSEKWFDNGKIKFDDLLSIIKDHEVPVANCSKQFYDSHEKCQMKFSDYVDYWQSDRKAAGFLYLKDFHLKQEFPDLDFYQLPFYFASDWLNEYLVDTENDDYRFIYFGPKDSWTSFHSDVFGSFSWSANIYGRKHWLLLPSEEEVKLKDGLGNLPFMVNRELLNSKNVKFFDFIQECNETVFVPSGWYHQVLNIEDAVSVNHNWFNGCNVAVVADNLVAHFEDVVKEIEDCRDMENFSEHCQLMLKSSFGMNFKDFSDIMFLIINKRIESLTQNDVTEVFDKFYFGRNHILTDLKIISKVLVDLVKNPSVAQFRDLMDEAIKRIEEVL